ncbi:NADPH-dependent 2,4-dienoyl-CoA reductase [Pseudomonas syringae pv. actinidiae]|uniref:NADPH-dependent 2,4-dienoyl-CoA reductase n=1 Tax=Pseudomonas syringae pv. actinidiae TaxID=103796 RepID=A0A2V0QDG2_PSESF|nr:NADPH-dependent 2,4-dienoyl-CoA reductase [Pseudomonas syringae pv. actinidiae]
MLFTLTTQGFDAYDLCSKFFFTEDQRVQRAALVSLLELALEAASTCVDLQAQVGQLITDLFGQRQRSQFGRFAEGTQVDIDLTANFFGNLFKGLKQQYQTLDAHCKTDAGSGFATHLLDQTVVAPPRADRTLSTQLIGDPFENGLAVVIQPAYQLGVDDIRNASSVQTGLEGFEVDARLVIQIIRQLGRINQHSLGFRVLGVQYAQRIGFQATLAVFIQLIKMGRKKLDQCIAVTRTRLAGAQAVQLKLDRIANAQHAPQAPGHDDQFGIDVRTVKIENLDTNLVKLAIAAFLWTLVAKHRPDVPQFLNLTATGNTVFKNRTHTGGSAFRAQGQRVAVTVGEGVHLFFDDISHFADRALEQVGKFDDRHTNLPVTVVIQQTRNSALKVTPQWRLLRQNVVHATNGL